ncbi:uncharacterized protein N7479_004109 [Penicillium vulpinum]|uniref:BTB domain-containing protein n=1 Tax=Penicillium vulpinum TaxID=29845 RepID=A0A1V6SD40_9EURO|nr:uncharacterized protein N7479_004109 [Penicillium vulpinum]KAJ5964233.1 hypothetical protein N7479_004109 [Penicillium vulpinum]OQE11503.1 hypothetical protein PENVUL_c002G03335 [Penicillium vulpinum]
MVPLYHGPLIEIRLEPSGQEYTISRDLLCTESPVFSAMFKSEFRESQEQTVTLQEEAGIISTQGVEALIQWLYLRVINFDIDDNSNHISAAIELARLADKYGIIIEIESYLAEDIKRVICTAPWEKNYWLTTQHLVSGTLLPRDHPVRRTLAAACVQGYLEGKTHKFAQEAAEQPNFGADLLREVRLVLSAPNGPVGQISFRDPIDNKPIYLGKD